MKQSCLLGIHLTCLLDIDLSVRASFNLSVCWVLLLSIVPSLTIVLSHATVLSRTIALSITVVLSHTVIPLYSLLSLNQWLSEWPAWPSQRLPEGWPGKKGQQRTPESIEKRGSGDMTYKARDVTTQKSFQNAGLNPRFLKKKKCIAAMRLLVYIQIPDCLLSPGKSCFFFLMMDTAKLFSNILLKSLLIMLTT